MSHRNPPPKNNPRNNDKRGAAASSRDRDRDRDRDRSRDRGRAISSSRRDQDNGSVRRRSRSRDNSRRRRTPLRNSRGSPDRRSATKTNGNVVTKSPRPDPKLDTPRFTCLYFAYPRMVTDQEIQKVFAPFGHIEEVRTVRAIAKSTQVRGVYIKYAKASSLASAVEQLDGCTIGRCEIPVVIFVAPRHYDPETHKETQFDQMKRLFCHVDRKTDKFQIREIFKQYGEVLKVHVVPNKAETRCLAYIMFAKASDAARALEDQQGKGKLQPRFSFPLTDKSMNDIGLDYNDIDEPSYEEMQQMGGMDRYSPNDNNNYGGDYYDSQQGDNNGNGNYGPGNMDNGFVADANNLRGLCSIQISNGSDRKVLLGDTNRNGQQNGSFNNNNSLSTGLNPVATYTGNTNDTSFVPIRGSFLDIDVSLEQKDDVPQIIVRSRLAENFIVKLLDLVPGLVEVRKRSTDYSTNLKEFIVVYENTSLSKHAREKLNHFEYPSGDTITADFYVDGTQTNQQPHDILISDQHVAQLQIQQKAIQLQLQQQEELRVAQQQKLLQKQQEKLIQEQIQMARLQEDLRTASANQAAAAAALAAASQPKVNRNQNQSVLIKPGSNWVSPTSQNKASNISDDQSTSKFSYIKETNNTPATNQSNITSAARTKISTVVLNCQKQITKDLLTLIMSQFNNFIDVHLDPDQLNGYARYSSEEDATMAANTINGHEIAHNFMKARVKRVFDSADMSKSKVEQALQAVTTAQSMSEPMSMTNNPFGSFIPQQTGLLGAAPMTTGHGNGLLGPAPGVMSGLNMMNSAPPGLTLPTSQPQQGLLGPAPSYGTLYGTQPQNQQSQLRQQPERLDNFTSVYKASNHVSRPVSQPQAIDLTDDDDNNDTMQQQQPQVAGMYTQPNMPFYGTNQNQPANKFMDSQPSWPNRDVTSNVFVPKPTPLPVATTNPYPTLQDYSRFNNPTANKRMRNT